MKTTLLKCSATLIIGIVTIINSSPSAVAATPAIDECAKELLLSYFPEPIVAQTLKKFNVPQEKWAGISQSLSSKDKDIVKLVEQKASSMNPNPLKDPQQRQAAVKLFRETLLTVFSDAMKENGITDATQYQAMLDDIQQQKAKKFAMCMEKQKAQMQSGQPAPSSSKATDQTNDDDADYDDSDSDDNNDSDSKDESES